MMLYHVTRPKHVAAIMADGFKDSFRFGRGVWLSDELWDSGATVSPAEATMIGPERAIFRVDVPDAVAAEFEVRYENLDPSDPDYDPEIDTGEVYNCYREWCIPAEIVNAHQPELITAEQLDAEHSPVREGELP